ncbi:RNA polymerase sigma factor [Polluticaenibacter yanchengensis]|uniref:RNA polymerase sigma factor n=1 Tax=Polluticaenibacter yanchengensis TaxID=3014562 RepID=A0ABT4UNQ1_9BACT|nr:RNA polymerase sigma factor [Chitinophagaceae bacterium LY-5]
MTTDQLHIIIDGCRKNNREAQEKLYKYFYADMVKVCQRYISCDDQKIVSVLNDAYLKMFKNIDKYNQDLGTFNSWFKTIVINTVLTSLSERKRQIEYIYTEELPEYSEQHNIYSRFDLQELMEYIKILPNVTRTVFNMAVLDGFTHQEISQLLNITESTSRWHLSDARKKLKDKLKLQQY